MASPHSRTQETYVGTSHSFTHGISVSTNDTELVAPFAQSEKMIRPALALDHTKKAASTDDLYFSYIVSSHGVWEERSRLAHT